MKLHMGAKHCAQGWVFSIFIHRFISTKDASLWLHKYNFEVWLLYIKSGVLGHDKVEFLSRTSDLWAIQIVMLSQWKAKSAVFQTIPWVI